MQNLKFYTYATLLLATIVTIVIGITSLDTFSLGAMGFLLWSVLPYFGAIFMIKYVADILLTKITLVISWIIAIGGMYIYIDAMYLDSDPQSALVFAVIPMYQWLVLLSTLLILYIVSRYKK